nr:reverse transcriptase domain-containing protein [Tanacetum cinerariifolium]
MRKKSKEENVNYDYCEIETKNVELENSVAKLLSKNERLYKEINHVKQVFKEQFDSIKKTRVCTKEQGDSLIDKLNLKSVENEDLKAQIQDKVFVITSLKNYLQTLEGKEIIDIVAQTPSAYTIVPGMFKLDLDPLAPKLLHNRVESSTTSYSNTHVLSPTGLKCSTSNCESKPTENIKNDRILQAPSRNMKNKVEAQPRKVNKKNNDVEPICDVVQIIIWYLDSGCSKHMTGNRSQLMKFVSKFLGIVRFGNDHIARIMGYGDYQLRNATISKYIGYHNTMNDLGVGQSFLDRENNRTMAQMLQAPIEGYEDAIVVPQINANNFELKQTLINLVQSNQFTGRQDPHNHLRFFNKVTSTFRHPEVPNTTIKLLLFPFSLEGEARIWLDKEPTRSILTWEYLVSKFINQFFPPSKTTYLRNEITNFLQKPNETYNKAWERFKDLLRQCPHHGFSELHQLDTFYNALNPNDQDALDSAAGGNFLDKIPRECLSIIESKSKVRYSRSRVTDVRANANAPPPPS